MVPKHACVNLVVNVVAVTVNVIMAGVVMVRVDGIAVLRASQLQQE